MRCQVADKHHLIKIKIKPQAYVNNKLEVFFMIFRTDLALERREFFKTDLPGVGVVESENDECKKTFIEITNKKSAQKLGKGVGKYITLEMREFSCDSAASSSRVKAVVESLRELLPYGDGTVLVAGVGNASMTSDALGPKTASKIFATRHIGGTLQKSAGFSKPLRSVASVSTGVLGQTGLESSEYIKCICGAVKPCCVITIDALAAGSVKRLGKTIQMSNTGIAPGSGIGNARKRIDESYLGVPVIAVGIPTVVDAVSLACEICEGSAEDISGEALEEANGLVVAPKDVDLLVENAAYLLALSLNCALQPTLTPSEVFSLM